MAMLNTLAFTAYAAFLTYVSLRPSDTSGLDPWDKLAHFAAYAVFALLARGVVKSKSAYVKLCCGIVVYGGAMECLQSFMPGRVMSLGDLIANTIGVVVAALLVNAFSDRGQSTR